MTPLGRLRAAMKACRAEKFELDGLTESAPKQILEWVARRMPAWAGKGKEATRARVVLSELEAAAKTCAYPKETQAIGIVYKAHPSSIPLRYSPPEVACE